MSLNLLKNYRNQNQSIKSEGKITNFSVAGMPGIFFNIKQLADIQGLLSIWPPFNCEIQEGN